MANRPELPQQLKAAPKLYPVSPAVAEMEPVPDSMLVEHLTLANTQLRQVLGAAGLHSALSLQPSQDLQCSMLQQQITNIQQSADKELVAVLAEENYQLRQLVQQVQLQQQLQHVQQQHEAAAAADLLQFDRFDSSEPLPAVAARTGSSPVAAAAGVAPLHGPTPLTPQSPAVLAAGILVPPSASAVQLAEAEAAAQLMTQAVIQAEAAAHDGMAWQTAGADDRQQQLLPVLHPSVAHHCSDYEGQLSQTVAEAVSSASVVSSPVLVKTELQSVAAISCAADKQGVQGASGSLGLLNLPRLALPARALNKAHCRPQSEATNSPTGSQLASTQQQTQAAAVTSHSAAVGTLQQATALSSSPDAVVHKLSIGSLGIGGDAHTPQLINQQQQAWDNGRVSRQLEPQQPGQRQNFPQRQLPAKHLGAAAAAAQAAEAAAAFAGLAAEDGCVHWQPEHKQEQHQQVQDAMPGLPRLRVHSRPSDAAINSETVANDAISASCDVSQHPNSASSSPCSDSGYFRAAIDVDNSTHGCELVAAVGQHGSTLQGRNRGSEVFTTSSRMSSDFFGTRISMDGGSVGQLPRVSLTGGNGSRDELSELAGWYGAAHTFDDMYEGGVSRTNTLNSHWNSSEWLGVSYQRSWRHDAQDVLRPSGDSFEMPDSTAVEGAATAEAIDVADSIDQQWPTLPKLQLRTCNQRQASSSHACSRDQQQQLSSSVGPSSSLVPAPDIPDNYFFESSVSSLYDSFRSSQAGLKTTAAPSAVPSSSITAAAASAALDSGCLSRPASEITVLGMESHNARITEPMEAPPDARTAAVNSSAVAGDSRPSTCVSHQRQQQQGHMALPDLSLLDLSVTAGSQQPTPAIGGTIPLSTQHQTMADSSSKQQMRGSEQGQQQWVGGYTPEFAAAASAALNSVPGELEGMISSQQLKQLLMDLAMAQHRPATSVTSPTGTDVGSSCTPSTARSNLLSARSQHMFDAAVEVTGTADHRPAVTLQTTRSGELPPKSPTKPVLKQTGEQQPEQQQHHDGQETSTTSASLQRVWSSGSMSAQLPPRSATKSGSSAAAATSANLQQQESSPFKHAAMSHAGDAAHIPAPAVPVPVRQGSVTGTYSTLRVVTTLRAAPSTGTNSDADNSSTNTTPMHSHSRLTRNHSSSSTPYRPGSYLASVTVPPSPSNSGVRYMPASPRVVGFDCPATPQSAVRSPSWRSDHSTAGDSGVAGAGSTVTGPAGVSHVSHLSCSGVGGLGGGSSCSSPRRQPASPGLLHQALTRQGQSGGSSSNCSTPSGARRAGSVPCIPHFRSGSLAGALSIPVVSSSAFLACAGRGSDKQHMAGSTSSVHSTGPLGIPSPPAGGMGVAHHRARSCSSATLLKMLTGGPLQQTGLQNTSCCHPYFQQPQPLPLQQQQQQQQGQLGFQSSHRLQSDLSRAYSDSCQAAAVDGAAVVYGSAVEDAVDSELRASKSAADASHQMDALEQQQHASDHCTAADIRCAAGAASLASPARGAAARAAALDRLCRPASPLARSLSSSRSRSPSPGSRGSSNSCAVKTAVAGTAASAAKGVQEGHPVKLSRFGLMAAAEAHAAPATSSVQATAPVDSSRASNGNQSIEEPASATVDAIKQSEGGSGRSLLACIRTDPSDAPSVVSPDTPALGDPTHTEATCPAAIDASSSFCAIVPVRESARTASDNLNTSLAATASSTGDQVALMPEVVSIADSSAGGVNSSVGEAAAVEPAGSADTAKEAVCHLQGTAYVGPEPPTPMQHQPQQKHIAISRAAHATVSSSSTKQQTMPAEDAGAYALFGIMCSGKHHEVVVASGRRGAHALTFLSRHMNSNAADVIRASKGLGSTTYGRGKVGPAESPAVTSHPCGGSPVTPFASGRHCREPYARSSLSHVHAAAEECCSPAVPVSQYASGSSDSPGKHQVGTSSSSWNAQLLMLPLPQQLRESSTLDIVCDRDQQRQGYSKHDVGCVTPGFVKSRVRSWSQLGGQAESNVKVAKTRTRTAAAVASCAAVPCVPDARAESWCSKRLRSSAATVVRGVQRRPFAVQPFRVSSAGLLKSASKRHSKHRSAAAASLSAAAAPLSASAPPSSSSTAAAVTTDTPCSNPFLSAATAPVSLPKTTADGWVIFGETADADPLEAPSSDTRVSAARETDSCPMDCIGRDHNAAQTGQSVPDLQAASGNGTLDTATVTAGTVPSSEAVSDCSALSDGCVLVASTAEEMPVTTLVTLSPSVCPDSWTDGSPGNSSEPVAVITAASACAHVASQQYTATAVDTLPIVAPSVVFVSPGAAADVHATEKQNVGASSSQQVATADVESAAVDSSVQARQSAATVIAVSSSRACLDLGSSCDQGMKSGSLLATCELQKLMHCSAGVNATSYPQPTVLKPQQLAECVQQQSKRQLGQQQRHSSEVDDSEADALYHRSVDQGQQKSMTDVPAHAVVSASADGADRDPGQPHLSDLAPDSSSAVRAAAGAGNNCHSGAAGLVEESYCGSMASDSNLSWAAWSTTGTINKCPELSWWGDGRGLSGNAAFFSQKHTRKHTLSSQQQGQELHVDVRRSSVGFFQQLQRWLGI